MKPAIPSEFGKINNFMGLYYILHGLVIWLGLGLLAYLVYHNEQIALYLRLPIVAVCILLSGLGLFFMALLGHEGFHGSLNRDRNVSMALGILASSVIPFFVSVGYNVIHWQHHLYTNTLKDPDYLVYRKYKTFLSRVLFGPSEVLMNCFRNAVALAVSGKTPEKTFPFKGGKARFFACLNLGLASISIVSYGFLAATNFEILLFVLILPGIITTIYWAMAPYIEHAETDVGESVDTRTYTSRIFGIVLMGYNYHLCHHLYPRVQLHKLGRLHRYLVSNQLLPESAVIETSLLNVLKVGSRSVLDFPNSSS